MRTKTEFDSDDLRLGEISGLHGVQGWVKIFSDTEPRENIFKYQPWYLCRPNDKGGKSQTEVLNWRKQGKTLVAQLRGLEDREQARALIGSVILVTKNSLPELNQGEYYWSQLVGLRVKTLFQHGGVVEDAEQATGADLGIVYRLVETGANDVLVVCGDERSVDREERLIPWVPDQFILEVDLAAGEIRVDWDPEF